MIFVLPGNQFCNRCAHFGLYHTTLAQPKVRSVQSWSRRLPEWPILQAAWLLSCTFLVFIILFHATRWVLLTSLYQWQRFLWLQVPNPVWPVRIRAEWTLHERMTGFCDSEFPLFLWLWMVWTVSDLSLFNPIWQIIYAKAFGPDVWQITPECYWEEWSHPPAPSLHVPNQEMRHEATWGPSASALLSFLARFSSEINWSFIPQISKCLCIPEDHTSSLNRDILSTLEVCCPHPTPHTPPSAAWCWIRA